MDNELQRLMGTLDESMKSAPEGFEVPAGEYIMRVKSAEICKAKNSDRVHVKMECEILEGKFQGVPYYSYDLRFTDREGNPDDRGMSFFKLACRALGLEAPVSMGESVETVAMFADRVFLGRVVQNGEYKNLRIVRLIHNNYLKWVEGGCKDQVRDEKGTGW